MGQSHTTPLSICKEYLNHPLGLTLSTPSLVLPVLIIIPENIPPKSSCKENAVKSVLNLIGTLNFEFFFLEPFVQKYNILIIEEIMIRSEAIKVKMMLVIGREVVHVWSVSYLNV